MTKNKCTEHNMYGIKSLCSSTAVLDISSVTIGAIAGLLHTLSCSVSLWTEKDLDTIHALIPTLQNDYNTNTIDVIPQHIDISETKCQLVTLHKHNLTIHKTSADVNKLLKKIYDSKWRYLLLSIGKLSKTIVTLFILGSKIYIFEPHSYIPTTLGLSGLTYCSTLMSCAMYLQCVGKCLQCKHYTLKEVKIDTAVIKNKKHRQAQKRYRDKTYHSSGTNGSKIDKNLGGIWKKICKYLIKV